MAASRRRVSVAFPPAIFVVYVAAGYGREKNFDGQEDIYSNLQIGRRQVFAARNSFPKRIRVSQRSLKRRPAAALLCPR